MFTLENTEGYDIDEVDIMNKVTRAVRDQAFLVDVESDMDEIAQRCDEVTLAEFDRLKATDGVVNETVLLVTVRSVMGLNK